MGQTEFFAPPKELKIQPLCYVIVRFLERRGSIRLNSPPDKKFLSDLPGPKAKFRAENPQQNLGTDWPKEQSEPSRSWADNPPKSSHASERSATFVAHPCGLVPEPTVTASPNKDSRFTITSIDTRQVITPPSRNLPRSSASPVC